MSSYLDFASTSPLASSVMGQLDSLSQNWMNPSSVYAGGRDNRRVIENVRRDLAELINCDPDEIIFTSGGSESNALAIYGFLKKHPDFQFVPSTIEHSSVLEWIEEYPEFELLHVDGDGLVNLEQVSRLKKNSLISCMMVNNEIGTIEPVKELCAKAHAGNHIVHADAIQAFGKIPINVKDLDVDLMSFSGHKIGSIRGVGFLYVRKGIELASLIKGTQEQGLRGGTYNDLAIKTLGLALEDINYDHQFGIRSKRNYLLNLLLEDSRIHLNGSLENRIASNLNIRIDGIPIGGQEIVELMNEYRYCISAGSACHAGDNRPSHVLKAIGLSDEQARQSIRITIGQATPVYELERFVQDLFKVLNMFV